MVSEYFIYVVENIYYFKYVITLLIKASNHDVDVKVEFLPKTSTNYSKQDNIKEALVGLIIIETQL